MSADAQPTSATEAQCRAVLDVRLRRSITVNSLRCAKPEGHTNRWHETDQGSEWLIGQAAPQKSEEQR